VAAGQLNAANRTQNRSSMTGSEILQQIDKGEFNTLSATDQQRIWDLLHLGTLNPFGVESNLMADIFTGGSATITALQAARKIGVSRAVEIGLGFVSPGHVLEARK